MERPLALVAARNVVDDHSFVTGTSAMSFTLAAIVVDDGRVANTYAVLLPFKLLVPLSKNKETYLSPLLPKFTQAMVAWGSYANQLHATYSGMCSGLGWGRTHSVCLFPWDPGQKPVVLRDFVLNRDIPWDACIKKLNIDSSGSYDHRQKPGQYMEHLVACASAFFAEQHYVEEFLLGSVGIVQNNSQPHLEVSKSCLCSKLMLEGATLQGVKYFPWKIAWFLVVYSLGCSEHEGSGNLGGKCRQHGEGEPRPLAWPSFEHHQDGWQQGQPPHQLLSTLLVNFDYSLEAWVVCYIDGTCVSRFGRLTYADDSFVYGCEMTNGFHHKKPWDPGGILSRAWISQWQVVLANCKSRLGGVHSTLQWSPLQVNCHFAKMHFVLLTGAQMNEEINCGTSLNLVVYCRNPALNLDYTSSWRLMFAGFLLQYGPEAGVLLLLSSGHPVTIHCAVQGYTSYNTFLAILNERAVQQPYICTRVVIEAVQLLNRQSSSNHAIVWRNRTVFFDHRATITIVCFSQLLKLKRSSEEANGRRNAAASSYYRGHCPDHAYYVHKAFANHDYYLDVIPDQADIGHNYYIASSSSKSAPSATSTSSRSTSTTTSSATSAKS